MSDKKAKYSEESKNYASNSTNEREGYDRSKRREEKHNDEWVKHKVNLNSVIDKFAPDAQIKRSGSKLRFIGNDYEVITDMAAGYLRIYDKRQKCYVKLDGTRGNNEETHFKIKRREEM